MMQYTVVSASEWTYPDRREYASGSLSICLDSARSGVTGAQLLLFDTARCPEIALDLPGASAELFRLLPIPVESNPVPPLPPEMEKERKPFVPERQAPYFIHDCLQPYIPGFEASEGCVGLYIRVTAPDRPGSYSGVLRAGDTAIPVSLTVYEAKVPAETLQNVYWYSRPKIAECHGLEQGTPAFDAMEEKYLRLMREMRQTVLYVDHAVVTDLGDNRYSFDFTEIRRQLERGKRLGFQFFGLSSIGGRRSWKEPEIYVHGIQALSYEGYCFIQQYMTALREFLKEIGLLGKMRMGISDEPNAANEVTYRALAGLVRRYCPELILTEALSYCNIHGSINTYVPLNAEYQRHQKEFETFRSAGDELWQYVCCGPRADGFINRFLDYPLLSTRYQYWGNFHYGLTGYLHWAFFQPQPGQDLFKQSCPTHHNADSVGTLPPGDTHLCYPGTDGPWMSIRLEMLRQSAEEYEWLTALKKSDPDKADALCQKVFRAFNDVTYDTKAFEVTRRELLAAVR